jgi:hypothetical protein
MHHPRTFLVIPLLALAAALGCDTKKRTEPASTTSARPAADVEASVLSGLERQPNLEQCRSMLQQLDNLETPSSRVTLSDGERAELTSLYQMTEGESKEIAQASFTQADAAYLEECLLIRTALRGMQIDSRPALEKGRLGFDWACRMVYLDDRIPWPAPPWWALQTGSGVMLSRAYVILAVWQQLGLEGVLVGPPSLKTTKSYSPARPPEKPSYAPVRACGLRVDQDIYLFDPQSGRPLPAADGKGILTLAQAKAKQDAVKNIGPAGEAADWQPYQALPFNSLERRMQWLETKNPSGLGMNLFVDAIKLRPVAGQAWNPEGDNFTASRVLSLYATQESKTRDDIPFRIRHVALMIPYERLQRMTRTATPPEELAELYSRPFAALRFGPDLPRDLMLRGQFSIAIDKLGTRKGFVENARQRLEQDPDIQKDFASWLEQFRHLRAEATRAQFNNPADLPAATRALDDFQRNPHNNDIERTVIYGTAGWDLNAEVTYLMAACVHERAERAELDNPGQAAAQWQNAQDWWGRYLEVSAQAGHPIPSRDAHAIRLQARCRHSTQK